MYPVLPSFAPRQSDCARVSLRPLNTPLKFYEFFSLPSGHIRFDHFLSSVRSHTLFPYSLPSVPPRIAGRGLFLDDRKLCHNSFVEDENLLKHIFGGQPTLFHNHPFSRLGQLRVQSCATGSYRTQPPSVYCRT